MSTDGRDWTELGGAPRHRLRADGGAGLGGHLFVGDGPEGPSASLRLDDGMFTDAAMPELADRYGTWNQFGSAAWTVDVGDPPAPDWEPFEIIVEHDGFVITLLESPDGGSYVLTDATTGEVARAETVDPEATDDQIWECDEEVDQARIVIRDDGVEIVRIPGEVFDEAIRAAGELNEPEQVVCEAGLDDWRPDRG